MLRGSDEGGWVSAASAHYVDVDAADWTLPDEAFPIRAPPAPLAPLAAHASHDLDMDGNGTCRWTGFQNDHVLKL